MSDETAGEITKEFAKHLMARHAALAEGMRKVLDLIEQYTRFDFYMWLMHDPSGLQADPCKRAVEAKLLINKLLGTETTNEPQTG